MLYIVNFFKCLSVSFATISVCSIGLSLCYAWLSNSPRYSPAKRDQFADRIYQSCRVAQWTLIVACVLALLWFASYGTYIFFFE